MSSFAKTQNPQISVIGAGLAGLTVAYRLQEKGYDVHVYEARHRPGGRVLTAKVGEGYEELGGKNFLDGGDPIHSLRLFRNLGLDSLQYEIPFTPLYINAAYVMPIFEILKKFKGSADLRSKMEKIAAQSHNLQDVINTVFKDQELRLIFTAVIRNYEGSDPQNLDVTSFDALHMLCALLFGSMREAYEGRTPTLPWLTVKGGNAHLPLALSASLKNKVHYSHTLTNLYLENQKIGLKFDRGQEIQTDLIILALPCSVFEDIDFDLETIPPHTLDHIQVIQYGTNSKILFSCSPHSKTHEIFISPTLVSWSNYEDNIRTFYFGGEYGISDLAKTKLLFEQGIRMIKTVYPTATSKSQTLEPAQDIQLAAYNEGVFKSWALDAYSKGSYVNRAPGTAAWLNEVEIIKGEKVRKVFRPIKDKIFFAGEHATILEAFGTMEGAVESGERTARLIDKTLQLSHPFSSF